MAEAENYYKQAIAMTEGNPTEQSSYEANLGRFYMANEKYAKAEPIIKKALAVKMKLQAEGDPQAAACIIDLKELAERSHENSANP